MDHCKYSLCRADLRVAYVAHGWSRHYMMAYCEDGPLENFNLVRQNFKIRSSPLSKLRADTVPSAIKLRDILVQALQVNVLPRSWQRRVG